MTTLEDGSALCDKCGGDLTPVNVVNAVIVSVMLDDGAVTSLHYCKHVDAERKTKACAQATVVSATNLKDWKVRNPGVVFRLFDTERDLVDGAVGNT